MLIMKSSSDSPSMNDNKGVYFDKKTEINRDKKLF